MASFDQHIVLGQTLGHLEPFVSDRQLGRLGHVRRRRLGVRPSYTLSPPPPPPPKKKITI